MIFKKINVHTTKACHMNSQAIKMWWSEKTGRACLLFHITFLLLTEFTFYILCSTAYGTFGEVCNLNIPCEESQLLACISSHCQCESPSNQRFDNSSKRCLSVVGGPCTFNPPLSSESDVLNPKRRDCIGNAICVRVTDEASKNFTECRCKDGYIENSVGDCVAGLGKPCSYQPTDCNPLGMVVCKNGKCQCLDDLQVYDPDMKRCVSPAGTHCKIESLQLGCVRNAICYPFYYWIPPKCLCKPGYVQTKSRQCVPESEYNNYINMSYIQSTRPPWPISNANYTVQI